MARAKPDAATAPKPAAQKSTKATAKKAAAPRKEKATTGDGERKTRRSGGDRGWLAREIDKRLRKAKPGTTITVRELANDISNARGEHPSSGAVAAALLRWNAQGYIVLTGERPQAFKSFTKKYTSGNLDAFLADQKEQASKARAAKKAAKAA